MSIHHSTILLESCLRNTYFFFQGMFFEQTQGAVMAPLISLIVVNLCITDFKIKATNTATNPQGYNLSMLMTHLSSKKTVHSHQFPQHINSIDPHIQFNAETPKQLVPYPFGHFSFTWTGQYTSHYSLQDTQLHRLHWDSHQNLSVKHSTFNTLTHRASNVCASLKLLQKEDEHIMGTLQKCMFPNWALTRLKMKSNSKFNTTQTHSNNINNNNNHIDIHMMVPYTNCNQEDIGGSAKAF